MSYNCLCALKSNIIIANADAWLKFNNWRIT